MMVVCIDSYNPGRIVVKAPSNAVALTEAGPAGKVRRHAQRQSPVAALSTIAVGGGGGPDLGPGRGSQDVCRCKGRLAPGGSVGLLSPRGGDRYL